MEKRKRPSKQAIDKFTQIMARAIEEMLIEEKHKEAELSKHRKDVKSNEDSGPSI